MHDEHYVYTHSYIRCDILTMMTTDAAVSIYKLSIELKIKKTLGN